VMIEKNASTRFSQEPEVGVKCRCTRGYPRVAGEPGADRGMVVVGVVVDHHVQFPAGVGGGDLAQKGAELLVPCRSGQASVTLPMATSSAANSVVVPCRR
jgi:hypothetical protein